MDRNQYTCIYKQLFCTQITSTNRYLTRIFENKFSMEEEINLVWKRGNLYQRGSSTHIKQYVKRIDGIPTIIIYHLDRISEITTVPIYILRLFCVGRTIRGNKVYFPGVCRDYQYSSTPFERYSVYQPARRTQLSRHKMIYTFFSKGENIKK